MSGSRKRAKRNVGRLAVTIDEHGLVVKTQRIEDPSTKKTPANEFTNCSKCGKRIHRSDLREHHRNVHRIISGTRFAAPTAKKKAAETRTHRNKKQCSICKKFIVASKLKNHMAAVHNLRGPLRPVQIEIDKQSASNKITTIACPQCKVSLKPKNLKKHIRNVHGSNINARGNVSKSGEKKPKVRLVKSGKHNELIVVCPDCRVPIRKSRFASHKKRLHSKRSVDSRARLAKNLLQWWSEEQGKSPNE